MKYIDEFRNATAVKTLVAKINSETTRNREYRFMEFCGGHTHSIFKFGIDSLIPQNIKMIHGPGCPVCVLPIGRLDMILELTKDENKIICSYGDMMRVPGSRRNSLLTAKAKGANIKMVFSCMEAVKLAEANPDKEIIFFAIGFETTTPPTAFALIYAKKKRIKNFTVFCNHVLTPAAIISILESREVRELGTIPLDGFVGPGHVSAIIGSQPYEFFAEEYQKPVVISGFEPMDLLNAILMLVRQANNKNYKVENAYRRIVNKEGNDHAKKLCADVFELRKTFEWRGLGLVPYSALRLKTEFSEFDAEKKYSMKEISSPDHKGCDCGAVLRGLKSPLDCKLFGKGCAPENPIGSCMVSSEGACSAYYKYHYLNSQIAS